MLLRLRNEHPENSAARLISFCYYRQVTPISEDDYFEKNPEYSAWLRDLQHIHFNELAAEAARERFKVPGIVPCIRRALPGSHMLHADDHGCLACIVAQTRLACNAVPASLGGVRVHMV